VVAIGYMFWSFNQPPFSLSLLEQLEVGMTQDEVKSILGDPDSVDPMHWTYSRPFSWPIVHITFDNNGKFAESDYDY
jgi:hypothetical protein